MDSGFAIDMDDDTLPLAGQIEAEKGDLERGTNIEQTGLTDIDAPAVEPPRSRETGGVSAALMQPHDPATVMKRGDSQHEVNPLFQTSAPSPLPYSTPLSPGNAFAHSNDDHFAFSGSNADFVGTPIDLASAGTPLLSRDTTSIGTDAISSVLSQPQAPLVSGGVPIALDDVEKDLMAAAVATTQTVRSTPFSALVATLENEQREALIDQTRFTGVFFYDGGEHSQPPDVTASVQVMQSDDSLRWIVFRDESVPRGGAKSCRAPLDDYDALSAPFCHKSFAAHETDEAVDLARSLALKDSVETTAFVVRYRQVGGDMQATVVDSFTLTNKVGEKSRKANGKRNMNAQKNDRKRSNVEGFDASRPNKTGKAKWILWIIGASVIALVVALIALFVAKKRSQNVSNVGGENIDKNEAKREEQGKEQKEQNEQKKQENPINQLSTMSPAQKRSAPATPLAGTFF